MNRKRLIRAAGLMLALAPMVAVADDPPSLKEIMQGLRNNLAAISDGLLTDDFEREEGTLTPFFYSSLGGRRVALFMHK